jgi:hypothetical protein
MFVPACSRKADPNANYQAIEMVLLPTQGVDIFTVERKGRSVMRQCVSATPTLLHPQQQVIS